MLEGSSDVTKADDKSCFSHAEIEEGIHSACAQGNSKLCSYLIDLVKSSSKTTREEGTDTLRTYINTRNSHDQTPIFLACQNGHLETLKILHEAGGDLNLSDIYDFSPLQIACRLNHTEIVRYLLGVRSIRQEIDLKKKTRGFYHIYNLKSQIIFGLFYDILDRDTILIILREFLMLSPSRNNLFIRSVIEKCVKDEALLVNIMHPFFERAVAISELQEINFILSLFQHHLPSITFQLHFKGMSRNFDFRRIHHHWYSMSVKLIELGLSTNVVQDFVIDDPVITQPVFDVHFARHIMSLRGSPPVYRDPSYYGLFRDRIMRSKLIFSKIITSFPLDDAHCRKIADYADIVHDFSLTNLNDYLSYFKTEFYDPERNRREAIRLRHQEAEEIIKGLQSVCEGVRQMIHSFNVHLPRYNFRKRKRDD
jgi:hypothetical protein